MKLLHFFRTIFGQFCLNLALWFDGQKAIRNDTLKLEVIKLNRVIARFSRRLKNARGFKDICASQARALTTLAKTLGEREQEVDSLRGLEGDYKALLTSQAHTVMSLKEAELDSRDLRKKLAFQLDRNAELTRQVLQVSVPSNLNAFPDTAKDSVSAVPSAVSPPLEATSQLEAAVSGSDITLPTTAAAITAVLADKNGQIRNLTKRLGELNTQINREGSILNDQIAVNKTLQDRIRHLQSIMMGAFGKVEQGGMLRVRYADPASTLTPAPEIDICALVVNVVPEYQEIHLKGGIVITPRDTLVAYTGPNVGGAQLELVAKSGETCVTSPKFSETVIPAGTSIAAAIAAVSEQREEKYLAPLLDFHSGPARAISGQAPAPPAGPLVTGLSGGQNLPPVNLNSASTDQTVNFVASQQGRRVTKLEYEAELAGGSHATRGILSNEGLPLFIASCTKPEQEQMSADKETAARVKVAYTEGHAKAAGVVTLTPTETEFLSLIATWPTAVQSAVKRNVRDGGYSPVWEAFKAGKGCGSSATMDVDVGFNLFFVNLPAPMQKEIQDAINLKGTAFAKQAYVAGFNIARFPKVKSVLPAVKAEGSVTSNSKEVLTSHDELNRLAKMVGFSEFQIFELNNKMPERMALIVDKMRLVEKQEAEVGVLKLDFKAVQSDSLKLPQTKLARDITKFREQKRQNAVDNAVLIETRRELSPPAELVGAYMIDGGGEKIALPATVAA